MLALERKGGGPDGRGQSCSAELDGTGVSEVHSLQQARQRRALRRLGSAETIFGGASRRFQVAAWARDL